MNTFFREQYNNVFLRLGIFDLEIFAKKNSSCYHELLFAYTIYHVVVIVTYLRENIFFHPHHTHGSYTNLLL